MLNHEEIEKNSEEATKHKPFIDKYYREGISFPSEKNNWGKKMRRVM